MMSLNSAADNMGASLGTGVGGLVLLMYRYGAVGLVLETMLIAVGGVFYLLVSDPASIKATR